MTAPGVGPREADWIVLPTRSGDLSAMATRLLEAAERVGEDRWSVRTVSEGFKVPRAVAADLFPSLFGPAPSDAGAVSAG